MHPLFPASWMGSLIILFIIFSIFFFGGPLAPSPPKRNIQKTFVISTPLHMAASSTDKLRLGKQEGLKNIEKGQVHSVATAAQNAAGKSVHENVKGYKGDYLAKNLDHTIEKTELFNCSQF